MQSSNAAPTGKRKRDIPCCAILLVVGAIVCHTFVLMGNLDTAATFEAMGKSTGGWSDVGLGMSESMIDEVEHLMSETNHMLVKALGQITEIQTMMSFVIGASGNTTQMAVNIIATGDIKAVLEFPHNTLDLTGVEMVPLKSGQAGNTSNLMSTQIANVEPIHGAVQGEVSKLIKKLTVKIDEFWKMIRPALVQIGKWLNSMGHKMLGFIEQFSQTLDKAQKIFDQVMKELASPSDIKDKLVYNTFNIFDIHHKGNISVGDIKEVASLFGVTALAGSKGKELHKKYDEDKDGELNKDEYSSLMGDSSIPGAMPYVLRTFSKKLAQVAGKLKGAKKRDEVAESVVEYFQLMVAKNLTKTKWVADALTNGSLPVEFSADVFYQLSQQDSAPDKLTDLPVGEIIVGFMTKANAKHVHKTIKKLSDPAYWKKQGFDSKLQHTTVKTIKKWVKHSKKKSDSEDASLLEASHDDQSDDYNALLLEVDGLTDEVMTKRIRKHRQQVHEQRIKEHEHIFYADATKALHRNLLGDVSLKDKVGDPDIDRVTKGGVPAANETLKFAEWLVSNATATAHRFQKYAFDYAKTSSNPIDNFANQIQAFTKKVEQFLQLMLSYTTERGIHKLHKLVHSFIDQAENQINQVVHKLIGQMLDAKGVKAVEEGHISTLSLGSTAEVGSIFTAIDDVLNTLTSILPTVIDDIKFAKKEVSSVASTLKSTFGVFKKKGSGVFDEVASLYRTVWILYYVMFFILTLLILFYAFWAYDWFKEDEDKEDADAPAQPDPPQQNFCMRCCMGCLDCLRDSQDTDLCFWSCILISELVILIMFIVSVVFCILAGIKFFVNAGCSQIYVLGDEPVCTSILVGIQDWMSTFWTTMPSNIHDACDDRTLTTCKAISDSLTASAIQTVGGSFAAAAFSFQLLFLSAKLHERARYNHVMEAMNKADKES